MDKPAKNYKKPHTPGDPQKTTCKLVAVNEHGRRIGESHPGAKLSDHEIEQLFRLRDSGWGYRRIAKAMEISKRSVRDYCNGRSRCQTPARFKEVPTG